MIFYQLDYVVEKVIQDQPSKEQVVLRKLTDENFTKKEAKLIWEKVVDHKWYIGERLKRDVGERVAAVDYIENFYEPQQISKNKQSGVFRRIANSFTNLGRAYFVSKSRILS